MKKKKFLQNAAILTFTSLLLRAAGMYLRIYISGVIGAEGMGIYQMILSVYTLAAGFAASGIPVAVTRLTAAALARGDISGARGYLRKCLAVSLTLGMLSSAVILVFARGIGEGWLSDARSVMSVRVMAGALPFMAVSCCLRSWFTARRRVGTASCSQIAEQLARIALSAALLGKYAPMGAEHACFAVMLADVISEGAGCLYSVGGYLLDRRRLGSRGRAAGGSCREILGITAPITMSHYLTSLLRTVESVLVPDCLTRFYLSRTRSLELFGMLRGMAMPLIFFPSTLLGAIASLLVPELSAQLSLGDSEGIKRSVSRALKVTFMLAMPVAALFFYYGKTLGAVVYGQPEVGRLLRALSPLMPLMYSESVVLGLLRGLGEHKRPFYYSVADCVLRILLTVLLVPRMGMAGFVAVMTVSNFFTPVLNLSRLLKISGVSFEPVRWAAVPLFYSAVSLAAVYLAARTGALSGAPDMVRMAAGGILAAGAYAAMTFLGGGAYGFFRRSIR